MQLLERALADNDENIQLAVRDNDVLVKSGRTVLYTRLVEGRFPKWRDVFPRREKTVRVDLAVGPFHAAVRQAAIVTSQERRGVDFTFVEGKLILAAHGAEYGESHVEMPIAYEARRVDHHARPALPERFSPRLGPGDDGDARIAQSRTRRR